MVLFGMLTHKFPSTAYISTHNIQSTKRPSKFYSMGRNYKSGIVINKIIYSNGKTALKHKYTSFF